jgi:hypothetical protein
MRGHAIWGRFSAALIVQYRINARTLATGTTNAEDVKRSKDMTKKRYKLRPFSIAWWTVYGGAALFCTVGAYVCVCGAAAFGGM